MRNNLVTSLVSFLNKHNTSIEELNFLNSSNVDLDFGKLAHRLFFYKSDQQIWEETIILKNEVYRDVYGVNFCPFESLTNIKWEKMFRSAIAPAGDELETECKIVIPWFNFVLASTDQQHDTLFVAENQESLLLDFSYVANGGEYVKMHGLFYQYGEARVIAERQRVKRGMVHTRLLPPTFVIDWRLVEELKNQKEYYPVLERIYTLYYLAGHSPTVHSLFMETSPSIREKIMTDPVMSKLSKNMYFNFDGYEINYLRMHKCMFDLMCLQNPNLHSDILEIVKQVYSLTEHWDKALREYIQFIVFERAGRIIDIAKIIPAPMRERYVAALLIGGGKTRHPEWGDLYHFTHSFDNYEAIVSTGEGVHIEQISYKDMTKFMFDLYQK